MHSFCFRACVTVTILSKPKANAGNTAKSSVPVLDTSGYQSLEIRSKDVGIPGILRVSASSEKTKENVASGANKRTTSSGNGTRRRGRSHPVRMKEQQIPLSPQSRVRLTTDHPEWFEQMLDMPNGKTIVHLYDQLMVLQHRKLILIVSSCS